ncbi:MAG: TVP38/TMEM64 family protein [Alphaproteobacteria bacterium]
MSRGSMADLEPESRPRRSPKLKIVLLIGATLIVATGVTWGYALVAEMPVPGFELSVEPVAELIRSWGVWGMAATIGLMVVHSFVPFPAEFVALAAGLSYGPYWGTALTWTGAMLGALLSFGLARWLGRPFVEGVLRERYRRKLDDLTEKQGANTLLVSRLIPVIAFNLINYAAGLTNMSWLTFAWATGVGILPLTALMVVMGDRMTSISWWAWVALAAGAVVLWLAIRAAGRIAASRREDAIRSKE